jgi:N-acetylglutamate synthase-like GNAT family acetyltransferase
VNCEGLNIEPATGTDLGDILALLKAVGLPHEGVEEHLAGFLLARDAEGRLQGTMGLERHGEVGLLKSAAVAPGLQRSGVGSCLTSALLGRAAEGGVEKVLLITTTARDFFARRFGVEEAERGEFDSRLCGGHPGTSQRGPARRPRAAARRRGSASTSPPASPPRCRPYAGTPDGVRPSARRREGAVRD